MEMITWFIGTMFDMTDKIIHGPYPVLGVVVMGLYWCALIGSLTGIIYSFFYGIPKATYWESPNSRYGKIIRGILWPFYGHGLIPRPKPSFVINTHESMIRISGTGRKTLVLDEKTFVGIYWSNGKLRVGISGNASVTQLLNTTVK